MAHSSLLYMHMHDSMGCQLNPTSCMCMFFFFQINHQLMPSITSSDTVRCSSRPVNHTISSILYSSAKCWERLNKIFIEGETNIASINTYLFNFFWALGQIIKSLSFILSLLICILLITAIWIFLNIVRIGRSLNFLMLELKTSQWLFTNISLDEVVLKELLDHCSLGFCISHSWHFAEI